MIGLSRRAGWRDRHTHQLALIGYACLAGWALHAAGTATTSLPLAGITAIGLFASATSYAHARAIADIATSRIGSAAQGLVELVGQARADAAELIHSPCSGTPCVWYRYRVYSRDDAHESWRQIDSGTSHTTFELVDPTGTCRIDPEHAEVIAPEQRVTYRGDDKVVEDLLLAGRRIYVLGEFTTLRRSGSAASLSAEVGELLTQWKQDPARLQRRFDLNGDGEIDQREWELARRLALRTVEQQHRSQRDVDELHLVRAPTDGRLFVISTLPPQRTRQRYLAWSLFHLAAAALALAWLTTGHG